MFVSVKTHIFWGRRGSVGNVVPYYFCWEEIQEQILRFSPQFFLFVTFSILFFTVKENSILRYLCHHKENSNKKEKERKKMLNIFCEIGRKIMEKLFSKIHHKSYITVNTMIYFLFFLIINKYIYATQNVFTQFC